MTEAEIHKGIVEWLALALPPGSVVHHSPNEGKHRVQYRVHQKRMGMQAGWPDLELFIPPEGFQNGMTLWMPIFLEVKTLKGRLSDNQKKIHARLKTSGCSVVVVRSIEETEEALKRLIKLRI